MKMKATPRVECFMRYILRSVSIISIAVKMLRKLMNGNASSMPVIATQILKVDMTTNIQNTYRNVQLIRKATDT